LKPSRIHVRNAINLLVWLKSSYKDTRTKALITVPYMTSRLHVEYKESQKDIMVHYTWFVYSLHLSSTIRCFSSCPRLWMQQLSFVTNVFTLEI